MTRKKDRNALWALVETANIDPRIFTPTKETIDGWESFRLAVGSTPLYFHLASTIYRERWTFRYLLTTFVIALPKPAFPGPYGSSFVDFERIEKEFKWWLEGQVMKYIDYQSEEVEERGVPDLWAQPPLSLDLSTGSQSIQNTFFTANEQIRIEETLNGLEQEVRSRKILTENQTEFLRERIDYLIESSTRLGRKDWLAAAVGALVGFTLQAGLTSGTATQIIHLAGEALKWIAYTPLLLPK